MRPRVPLPPPGHHSVSRFCDFCWLFFVRVRFDIHHESHRFYFKSARESRQRPYLHQAWPIVRAIRMQQLRQLKLQTQLPNQTTGLQGPGALLPRTVISQRVLSLLVTNSSASSSDAPQWSNMQPAAAVVCSLHMDAVLAAAATPKPSQHNAPTHQFNLIIIQRGARH